MVIGPLFRCPAAAPPAALCLPEEHPAAPMTAASPSANPVLANRPPDDAIYLTFPLDGHPATWAEPTSRFFHN
jgi:hypothetical protein